MTFTLAATAFVLLFARPAIGLEAHERINLTVYYESLCGDSVRFITQQLEPSYDGLKEHINIDFVPYGKASQVKDEETGRWSFECQHKAAECKGNRDQACALHAIANNEEFAKRQDLSVKLVACVMGSRNPSTATTQCAENVGLSKTTQSTLAECQGSTFGDDLLAAHGDRTKNLNPSLTFVPTITVNGDSGTNVREDFKGVVCGLIPQNEKPTSCKST